MTKGIEHTLPFNDVTMSPHWIHTPTINIFYRWGNWNTIYLFTMSFAFPTYSPPLHWALNEGFLHVALYSEHYIWPPWLGCIPSSEKLNYKVMHVLVSTKDHSGETENQKSGMLILSTEPPRKFIKLHLMLRTATTATVPKHKTATHLLWSRTKSWFQNAPSETFWAHGHLGT